VNSTEDGVNAAGSGQAIDPYRCPNCATGRRGPVIDRAVKLLAQENTVAFCDWLKVDAESPPVAIGGEFAAETKLVELLAEIGPDRLLHAEYVRKIEADLSARMTYYRARIMIKHPGKSITQCAVILGSGRVRSCDDSENGFALGLREIYVREYDPAVFLSHPDLCAFAVLARGSRSKRARCLQKVFLIAEDQPERKRNIIIDVALELAPITLPTSMINRIQKEQRMTLQSVVDFYRKTDVGKEISHIAHDEGHEEGLEEGRAETLSAMIRRRFGANPDIDGLASFLAQTSDTGTSIQLIDEATSLKQLLLRMVPETRPEGP
jgi:hypothetical protein